MKFVLVGYGMAESPAREEHLEACHALRTQGFGEDDLRKLDEVVAAAEAVLQSDLEAGWDRLDALEEKYEDAPWMAVLKDQGGITGGFLKYPHALIKVYMKRKLGMKDSWFFDSRPLLRTTEIPMLWLLGGQDLEAPNEVTITELQRLHAQGRPIELIIFANADHGILDRVRGEEQRACLHPLRTGVLPGRKGMVVAADGPARAGFRRIGTVSRIRFPLQSADWTAREEKDMEDRPRHLFAIRVIPVLVAIGLSLGLGGVAPGGTAIRARHKITVSHLGYPRQVFFVVSSGDNAR